MPKAQRDQLDLQSQSLVPVTTARMEKNTMQLSHTKKEDEGTSLVVQESPGNAADMGSLPGRVIKIPHAGAKPS